MTWIDSAKDAWWLITIALLILGAYWKLAITTNKSKERLVQVEKNKKSIETLQAEMANIKDDIGEIKDGVDKQSQDTAAILSSLQSILNALCDTNSNVAPARDKFNEYLSKR